MCILVLSCVLAVRISLNISALTTNCFLFLINIYDTTRSIVMQEFCMRIMLPKYDWLDGYVVYEGMAWYGVLRNSYPKLLCPF